MMHHVYIKRQFVVWFSLFSLFFFWGGFTHFFAGDEGTGTGVLKSFFFPVAMLIYLCSLALLVSPEFINKFLLFSHNNLIFLAPLVYILISALWSYDKMETIRRSVALTGTTLFGIFIGLAYSRIKLLDILRNSLGIVVAASFFVAIFLPSYGVHAVGEFEGLWRGLLSFKNQMGWLAAIFMVFWLFHRVESKILWLAGVVVGGGVLFKTGSSTGLIALTSGVLVMTMVNFYLLSRKFSSVVIVLVILLLLAFSFINVETIASMILESMGKDMTLTGRISIWYALIPYIDSRPLLGFGYSAFWAHPFDFFGYSWLADLNHSHNTYFELILDLGLIGFVLTLGFIFKAFFKTCISVIHGSRSYGVYLSVLVMVLIVGVSGKVFYVPNSGIWVMIVALFTNLFIYGIEMEVVDD